MIFNSEIFFKDLIKAIDICNYKYCFEKISFYMNKMNKINFPQQLYEVIKSLNDFDLTQLHLQEKEINTFNCIFHISANSYLNSYNSISFTLKTEILQGLTLINKQINSLLKLFLTYKEFKVSEDNENLKLLLEKFNFLNDRINKMNDNSINVETSNSSSSNFKSNNTSLSDRNTNKNTNNNNNKANTLLNKEKHKEKEKEKLKKKKFKLETKKRLKNDYSNQNNIKKILFKTEKITKIDESYHEDNSKDNDYFVFNNNFYDFNSLLNQNSLPLINYNDYDENFSNKSDEYLSLMSNNNKKFLNEESNINYSIKEDYLNYIIITEFKNFIKDHLYTGEFDVSAYLVEFANDQFDNNLFNLSSEKVNLDFLEKLFKDKYVLSSFDYYINYEGSIGNILRFMNIQNISSDLIYKMKEYIFNFSFRFSKYVV